MTNEEKIKSYREKSMEELEKIAYDSNSSLSDMRIASIELGRKQYDQGMYYSTEEVLENIFGKNNMAREC